VPGRRAAAGRLLFGHDDETHASASTTGARQTACWTRSGSGYDNTTPRARDYVAGGAMYVLPRRRAVYACNLLERMLWRRVTCAFTIRTPIPLYTRISYRVCSARGVIILLPFISHKSAAAAATDGTIGHGRPIAVVGRRVGSDSETISRVL